MNTRTVTALTVALLAMAAARADTVTLADGSVLKGEVTIETERKVVLQRDTGRVVLERSQVASIDKAPFVMPKASSSSAPAPEHAAGKPAIDATPTMGSWPPRVGEAYPELALTDCNGKLFRLSSLRGKVILLEPVGMSCTGCQAFSGGHNCGGYLGVAPQPGIDSLEDNLRRFGNGVTLDSPDVAFVQVVLYNLNLQAPTVAEVKAWADHFRLSHRPNTYVLVGTQEMMSQASFDMIPGIHLIGRDFVLRSEHFGHGGGSDLYRELLPMTATLVAAQN